MLKHNKRRVPPPSHNHCCDRTWKILQFTLPKHYLQRPPQKKERTISPKTLLILKYLHWNKNILHIRKKTELWERWRVCENVNCFLHCEDRSFRQHPKILRSMQCRPRWRRPVGDGFFHSAETFRSCLADGRQARWSRSRTDKFLASNEVKTVSDSLPITYWRQKRR